jgi:hypothetical protein
MKLWYLVNSSEYNRSVYRTQFMNDEQVIAEQQKCIDCSGNEFCWIPASEYASSLPKDEIYCHIPSLNLT